MFEAGTRGTASAARCHQESPWALAEGNKTRDEGRSSEFLLHIAIAKIVEIFPKEEIRMRLKAWGVEA